MFISRVSSQKFPEMITVKDDFKNGEDKFRLRKYLWEYT